MTTVESVRRDYHAAFLGHLLHRDEASLRRGYEIGRRAVVESLNMLELAKIHHEVFRKVLAETPPGEMDDVAGAASEFFLEVLATYHMTHPTQQD
jgi:hypothetical protein